jgi:hypothetical protein
MLLTILRIKQFHSAVFVDSLTNYCSRHVTPSIDMHDQVFMPLLTFIHCFCVSVHLNPPWADLYSKTLVPWSMSIQTTPTRAARRT